MAFLMNDEWYSVVIDFECVSSRILWVKFEFSRVNACVVAVYSLIEEKEQLSVVDRIGNRYRLCVQGDLNGWVGNRLREGITGGFGVPKNYNCRRVINLCAEKGLSVSNTYFECMNYRIKWYL